MDPTGKFVNFIAQAAVGALVGAGINVAMTMVSNYVTGQDIMKGTLGAAASGAVTGGLMAVGVAPQLAGAAGGLVGNLTEQYTDDRPGVDLCDLAVATGIGAVSGNLQGANVPGINKGNGSWLHVTRTLETKLENGTIKNISTKSALKMAGTRLQSGGIAEGTAWSAAVNGSTDYAKAGQNAQPQQQGNSDGKLTSWEAAARTLQQGEHKAETGSEGNADKGNDKHDESNDE